MFANLRKVEQWAADRAPLKQMHAEFGNNCSLPIKITTVFKDSRIQYLMDIKAGLQIKARNNFKEN